MIYTVTFNPALDLFVESELVIGEINRVTHEEYTPGGKGINVSIVCKELDNDTVATGFIGGFTGEFIRSELEKKGVKHNFVSCDGITRINMKIVELQETHINLNGVSISREEFLELKEYLSKKLTSKDVLIISGNSAQGIGKEEFAEIANIANDKKALLVIDTNQSYLEYLLICKPFLIKPNVQELAGVFNVAITSEEEIIKYARKLQQEGARNVLVSNGVKGAILVTEEDVYHGEPLIGQTVNSIGSGDSMVAGFVCEWLKTTDYESALKMAITCGATTAFSTTLAKREDINANIDKAIVTKEVRRG